MWFLRRIQLIGWIDHVTYIDVLNQAGIINAILQQNTEAQCKMFKHIIINTGRNLTVNIGGNGGG